MQHTTELTQLSFRKCKTNWVRTNLVVSSHLILLPAKTCLSWLCHLTLQLFGYGPENTVSWCWSPV